MADRERQGKRNTFLRATRWHGARLEALDQDASFRQYYRLHGGPVPALLMDAPPDREAVAPFVNIARHLQSLSLSAPQVYHTDTAHGFCLLEDFGDHTFTRLLATGYDESRLYRLATDCLLTLHNHPQATAIKLPRRSATFLPEVLLFCDWFYPLVTGNTCPDNARSSFRQAWKTTLAHLSDSKEVLVLRDFHIDNTMLLKDRDGVQRCGLIDFQDATIGPAGYDLISLLEDARRDLPSPLAASCLQYYLHNTDAALNPTTFASDCAILAAQRHTRVIGLFVFLSRRHGKHHYLQHLQRITRLLQKNLNHPAMSAVATWMQTHCPGYNDPQQLAEKIKVLKQ